MQQLIGTVKQTWDKLSKPMQIGAGLLVVGVFLSLLLLGLLSSTSYQPLFTDLNPDDAAAVLAHLQDNSIQYQISDNGSTISIPESLVYETRLTLASQGIPRGGVVGFEIFQSTRLGETEADRQLRFLWALQGELTRTIREINEVEDARVHIVMPRRSLFVQESQPATASVLLHLRPGVRLSGQQVRGIAHLVATSVEGLSTENITIVDNNGNVLNDSAVFEGIDGRQIAQHLELQRAYERQLENSTMAMLERVYGYGNVMVRVSADMDFDLTEEFSEIFEPVTRDGGILRSEQIYEESYQGTGSAPGGVAGIDSNVPGYVGTEQGGTSEFERQEATRNYEINRTERRHTQTPGRVERLSVAVWINGELNPAQLNSVEESVSRALGMRVERGDDIFVDSSVFESGEMRTIAPDDYQPASSVPNWIYVVIPLSLVALIFLLKRKKQPETEQSRANRVDITVGEEEKKPSEPELSPEEKERLETRKRIKGLAQENPKDVAQLLKTWLADE